jgi:hypothetical protein
MGESAYFCTLKKQFNHKIANYTVMLSKILSVTGRPGLYKLISTGKNLNIVESLGDGKRLPVYLHEKVVALSDVSIYTSDGDTPLREVMRQMKEKEKGGKASIGSKASGSELFAYLKEVLPDYSRESVYASDVKKIISWYNILIENGIDLEKVESTASDETDRTTTDEA